MTTIASLAVDVAVNPAGAILGIAALGAVIVGASVKMAGDFQQSMTQLVTSAGESKANLKMVGDGILAMAVETATSTQQLSSGMYMIESAGFHGAAGLNVLKLAAEGAKSENADLGTVANAVTSALNAYHYSADQAAFVTNVLVGSVAAGKMHMQDLAAAVSNVLPASAKFHISLIDVTAGLATMTMQGDNASSAATHLRQVILALEAPSKAGAKALASIGLSSEQVSKEMSISLPGAIQMITDALGKKFPEGSYAYNEALKSIAGGNKQLMGLLELSGTSLQTYKDNVASVTKAVKDGGSSINGWSTIQQNFNFKIAKAGEEFQTLGIKLGTVLLPAVTSLVGWIGDNLSGAFDSVMRAVTPVGALLSSLFADTPAQVQPAVAAYTTTEDVMKKVNGRFIETYTSVHHAGTAMQTTPAKASPFKQFLSEIGRIISKDILPALQSIGTWITTQVVPALQKLWTYAQQNILPILDALAKYIVTNVLPVLEKLGTWILTKVLPVLEKFFTWFAKSITPALQTLWTVISTQVIPGFQSIWDEIANKLIPAVQKLWDKISPVLVPALKGLGWTFTNVVVPAVKQMIDNLATLIGWIDTALTKIGDFLGKMGAVKDSVNSVIIDILKKDHVIPPAQLQKHADGGFVDHTGWAMVGERGPEVVRLPTGSQVYPHGITPAGLTGGGGSHKTYNVNVYPQQVSLSEKALADELRWQDVIHGQ